jgi:hypothetical protein
LPWPDAEFHSSFAISFPQLVYLNGGVKQSFTVPTHLRERRGRPWSGSVS